MHCVVTQLLSYVLSVDVPVVSANVDPALLQGSKATANWLQRLMCAFDMYTVLVCASWLKVVDSACVDSSFFV